MNHVECAQVAAGIPNGPDPILQLKKPDVPEVIECPFAEELVALPLAQFERAVAALGLRLFELMRVIFQRRLAVMRTQPIRAAIQFVPVRFPQACAPAGFPARPHLGSAAHLFRDHRASSVKFFRYQPNASYLHSQYGAFPPPIQFTLIRRLPPVG